MDIINLISALEIPASVAIIVAFMVWRSRDEDLLIKRISDDASNRETRLLDMLEDCYTKDSDE